MAAHEPTLVIWPRTNLRSGSRPVNTQCSRWAAFHRDLAGEKTVNFSLTEPGLAQDFARMLTEARRRIAQPTVGVAEPHRWSHHPDAPLGGMVDPREHVYCSKVLVHRQLGKRVDRPAWNVGRLQLVEPERGRLIANAFGDQRVKLGDVAAAGLRVGEARVPRKLRSPSDVEEILPVPIGIGEDAYMPGRPAVWPPVGSEHPGITRRSDRPAHDPPPPLLPPPTPHH